MSKDRDKDKGTKSTKGHKDKKRPAQGLDAGACAKDGSGRNAKRDREGGTLMQLRGGGWYRGGKRR